MPSSLIYPSIMLVAGVGIPVMAALNSSLGVKLGSSALATAILFFVGLVISMMYLLTSEGISNEPFQRNIAWYLYLGGALVVFYILSVTWVSPRYGIGTPMKTPSAPSKYGIT